MKKYCVKKLNSKRTNFFVDIYGMGIKQVFFEPKKANEEEVNYAKGTK